MDNQLTRVYTPQRFFKSLGQAGLFFAIYLGVQLVLGIVMVFFMAASLFAQLPDAIQRGTEPSTEFFENFFERFGIWYVIIGAATLLTFFLIFKLRKKNFFNEISFQGISKKAILCTLFYGIAAQLFVNANSVLFTSNTVFDGATATLSLPFNDFSTFYLYFLSIAIVAPIVEEVLFRGLIFSRLRRGMPMVIALLIQALLFGVLHISPISIANAIPAGIVLGLVYEHYSSTLASILLHAGFNATSILALFLPNSPEVQWVCLIVGALAMVACAILIIRDKPTPPADPLTLEII